MNEEVIRDIDSSFVVYSLCRFTQRKTDVGTVNDVQQILRFPSGNCTPENVNILHKHNKAIIETYFEKSFSHKSVMQGNRSLLDKCVYLSR